MHSDINKSSHPIASRAVALLTGVLSLMSAAPASAEQFCYPVGQIPFFATYGDNTQSNNGANSVDDYKASLYAMPATFINNISGWWGNGVAGTDVVMVDAARPFVLQHYPAFDATRVESAFIRFDLYYSHYSNTEGIAFIDDSNLSTVFARFAYYDRLQHAIVGAGMDRDQWVSIRIDLVTGNAFASRIDSFGNPTWFYGLIGTWGEPGFAGQDQGTPMDVLKEAADGDLYGLVYDDMNLSYVAMYGITEGRYACTTY